MCRGLSIVLAITLMGPSAVQYNSTTDDLSVNARLRYNFREGRDLWLVYNETLDTERAAPLTQPPPPFTQNRTVVVKYTHTLIW